MAEQLTAVAKRYYQDGNDLHVVYSNVFNANYSLENFIRDELVKNNNLPNLANEFSPVSTPKPSVEDIKKSEDNLLQLDYDEDEDDYEDEVIVD